MIDVSKQIEHWRSGANEDWNVAKDLVGQGKIRHGLFFAHPALEKVLKAHVCRKTDNIAPPTYPQFTSIGRKSITGVGFGAEGSAARSYPL